MMFLLGIGVAAIALISAVIHLNQEAAHFWDFVAFACVSGGTLAVALMTFPWQYRKNIVSSILSLIYRRQKSENEALIDSIRFLREMNSGATKWSPPAAHLTDQIFKDAIELSGLGFNKEKIHSILEERILQNFERSQRVANSFRSLAKYPPAFGLAGTVLGLTTLMRKVSGGADAKQTGFMMAIALMATFYGLLTANLIVNPAGEALAKMAMLEKRSGEIALHAVLLWIDGANLLEAQEILNSYVAKEHRVNVLTPAIAEAA